MLKKKSSYQVHKFIHYYNYVFLIQNVILIYLRIQVCKTNTITSFFFSKSLQNFKNLLQACCCIIHCKSKKMSRITPTTLCFSCVSFMRCPLGVPGLPKLRFALPSHDILLSPYEWSKLRIMTFELRAQTLLVLLVYQFVI